MGRREVPMKSRANARLRTQMIGRRVLIAGLLLAVPRSAVLGQAEVAADHDWKTELEQTFELAPQDVELGRFVFLLESDCGPIIDKYGSCFGNNPASPYGTYEFADYAEPEDSFRWRLAENQAVLFIGLTPPMGRYYSFQAYPFSRHKDNLRLPHPEHEGRFCDAWADDGSCLIPRRTLLGKMGLNLNHLELLTDGGDEDSFERFTVVVTTANQAVEERIRARLPDRLAELGVSPNVINLDPIPCVSTVGDAACDDDHPNNLVLGSEPESDDFMMALRLAITESLAAQQAYLEAPPVAVLRVTFPDLAATFTPYPRATPAPGF